MEFALINYFLVFIAVFFVIYSSIFHLILLFENREKFNRKRPLIKGLSLIIPAFNESKNIIKTLKRVVKMNYPKNKMEVLVIDDGSEDNTFELAKNFSKNYKFIKVFRKEHSGKSASINFGIKKSKNEFVAIMDADVLPDKNALINCMKYFDSNEVAAVTSRVLQKRKNSIWERWQDIELKIISLSRKIREKLNLIDSTPGALSVYRKNILEKIGLFDEKNLLEDVEIAWRILRNGYKIKMAYNSKVYTNFPSNFQGWLRQRTRWHIGWLQTIFKHINSIFKNPPLGTFILPFSLTAALIQILILFLSFYLISNWLIYISSYIYNALALKSSINLFNFNLQISVFNFYGAILLFLSLFLTYYSIKDYKKMPRLIDFLTFIFFYAVVFYPCYLINSILRIILRKFSWMTK